MQEVENSNVTWSASTFRYLGPDDRRGDPERWRRASGPTSTSGSALRPPATARSRTTSVGAGQRPRHRRRRGRLPHLPARERRSRWRSPLSMTSMVRAPSRTSAPVPRLRLRRRGPPPQAGVERQARPGRGDISASRWRPPSRSTPACTRCTRTSSTSPTTSRELPARRGRAPGCSPSAPRSGGSGSAAATSAARSTRAATSTRSSRCWTRPSCATCSTPTCRSTTGTAS